MMVVHLVGNSAAPMGAWTAVQKVVYLDAHSVVTKVVLKVVTRAENWVDLKETHLVVRKAVSRDEHWVG